MNKNSKRDPELAKMSGAELSRTLARAVRTPSNIQKVDATLFGETQRTYLMGGDAVSLTNATTSTSQDLIYTTNTVSWPASGQQWVLEDQYLWAEGEKPQRIGPTKVREAGPGDETDMAWLARRVREICWVPA
jgi:hypothetical protein